MLYKEGGTQNGEGPSEKGEVPTLEETMGIKFANTIFYFLHAYEWSECKVIVNGKPINCRDENGMQVPYLLKFHAQKSLIGILK